MAKKKTVTVNPMENEAEATLQPITETLEKNYMPMKMETLFQR